MNIPKRIEDKIKVLWGTAELVKYLDDLLLYDRIEVRAGFSPDEFRTLWLIRDLTNELLEKQDENPRLF